MRFDRVRTILLLFAVAGNLVGCSAVGAAGSLAGSAVSTGVSVAGSAVSTTASVAGTVVKTVTP
jgi:hypothetical protein